MSHAPKLLLVGLLLVVASCAMGNAGKTTTNGGSCDVGEFQCADGGCIPSAQSCDKIPNCEDGSDETSCPATCASSEFACGDGTCIDREKVCDDSTDCADGSDQLKCGGATSNCESNEFECNDGSCVRGADRCNGVPNCSDRSDENSCPDNGCPAGALSCGGTCVAQGQICDGTPHCPDNADEDATLCGTSVDPPPQPTPPPQPPPQPQPTDRECEFHEFTCDGGKCIPLFFRCDSESDCPDGDDETGC